METDDVELGISLLDLRRRQRNRWLRKKQKRLKSSDHLPISEVTPTGYSPYIRKNRKSIPQLNPEATQPSITPPLPTITVNCPKIMSLMNVVLPQDLHVPQPVSCMIVPLMTVVISPDIVSVMEAKVRLNFQTRQSRVEVINVICRPTIRPLMSIKLNFAMFYKSPPNFKFTFP